MICIKSDQKTLNFELLRFFKNLGFFEAIFQPATKYIPIPVSSRIVGPQ